MVRVVPATHRANAVKEVFVDSAFDLLPVSCKKKPEPTYEVKWPSKEDDDYPAGLDEDARFDLYIRRIEEEEQKRIDSQVQKLEILQSSFGEEKLSTALVASDNGLVYSIIEAYCQHHHLRLRAEDIWFAILSQISIYINANAETLRNKFVEHEGQKKLSISYEACSRHSFDFRHFARDMEALLDSNILDKEFRGWLVPDFTTTNLQDRVIASILMMGSMQKYFSYECGITCGIPSVTLLGEKADYEKILQRLDYLPSLGEEPKRFADCLRPIMSRIVNTFDNPSDPAIVNFWQRVVDKESGSGFTYYSGWLTAFCFWDEEGRCLQSKSDDSRQYSLDGISYRKLERDSIPPGWCRVPVTVDDNGIVVETEMVAGSVGIVCSSSGLEDASGVVGLDTMQPEAGWFIYEKKPDELQPEK